MHKSHWRKRHRATVLNVKLLCVCSNRLRDGFVTCSTFKWSLFTPLTTIPLALQYVTPPLPCQFQYLTTFLLNCKVERHIKHKLHIGGVKLILVGGLHTP